MSNNCTECKKKDERIAFLEARVSEIADNMISKMEMRDSIIRELRDEIKDLEANLENLKNENESLEEQIVNMNEYESEE